LVGVGKSRLRRNRAENNCSAETGARPARSFYKIRTIEWGEEHGLILDKKGRLFGMGRTNYGLLGLEDQETNEIVINPKQITINLPKAGTLNQIIEAKCGRFHSVIVTKKG